MEKEQPTTVPYVVYSDTVANYHWVIRKLVIALVVAVFLMFASNAAWLYVWQLYDYTSDETVVESDGNSVANYTGGDGGVTIGGTNNGSENNPDETQ